MDMVIVVQKEVEKIEALRLRGKGFSYREILEKVPVAKSTLSLWLRNVGLSNRQKQRLTDKKLAAMKRGWKNAQWIKIKRSLEIRKNAEAELSSLSKRERWLSGIMLYWAEGSKERVLGKAPGIRFSNSDVAMLVLFRSWLMEFLDVRKEQLRYELYIHENADWSAAKKFWASKLHISKDSIRVYFKRNHPKPNRRNIGSSYQGLIRICVLKSISSSRKISGWIGGVYKNWGIV